MDDIRSELRPMIRSRAKTRSREICEIVAGQGKNFIEQTLSMSNFADLKQAIKDKQQLSEDLKERFMDDYLKLNQKPNWLDELMTDFAEDVRAIIMPEWKGFMRRVGDDQIEPGKIGKMDINWDILSDSLIQALNTLLSRLVGIGILTIVLAIMPGAQVIDAIVVGIMTLATSFTDPLAKSRQIAIQKVEYHVKAQEYEISNRLLEAGLAGNDHIANQIREKLSEESNKAKRAIVEVSGLMNALLDTRDRLESIANELNSGGGYE